MLDEVVKLLEIQRMDQKIERLDQKLAEIPRGIETVQADLLKKRARLDAATARITDAEKKKKKLEADIEDGKVRAVKLDGQLMSVKTNQEYRAMLTQIQGIKDQSSDKETEILMLLEQFDALTAEKQNAASEFKTFEATTGEELAARKKHSEELQAERKMAVDRKAELTASLDKKTVVLYEKIRKKLGTPVVVELHGEICQGCNLSLRPQHANFIKEGREVYTCEYCYRILYYPAKAAQEEEQVSS